MKKAFHWLLVHPIAFAWILAAIAIVLNWIVGSAAPPKKEHQAKAAQHETQTQQGSGHEPAAGHEQASTQAQAAAAMPAESADAHQQAAVTEPAQEANAASSSVAEQAAATAAEPVNAAVATAAAGATAVAAGAAAAGTATVNENSSAEDLLLAAREAYWSGEYDQSVGFYQSLLKKENKPEHKGELANVYWKQGKSTEAVSLYAEIAPWLAEQGRTAELQSIKVYADVVDPTKAAEIGASIK